MDSTISVTIVYRETILSQGVALIAILQSINAAFKLVFEGILNLRAQTMAPGTDKCLTSRD